MFYNIVKNFFLDFLIKAQKIIFNFVSSDGLQLFEYFTNWNSSNYYAPAPLE